MALEEDPAQQPQQAGTWSPYTKCNYNQSPYLSSCALGHTYVN
jgi:hypothetical protein